LRICTAYQVVSVVDEGTLEQGFSAYLNFILRISFHPRTTFVFRSSKHRRYAISKTNSLVKHNTSAFCQRIPRDLIAFFKKLYQVDNNDGLLTCTEFSTILFVLVLLCETYGTVIGHLAAAAANSMVDCLAPTTNTRPVSLKI
jgi:hypothetical protein